MRTDGIDPATLPVRPALAREIERGWQRLAEPGTWWTSAERLAIAAEARHVTSCDLCRRRATLSPYTVDGSYASLGVLGAKTSAHAPRPILAAGSA